MIFQFQRIVSLTWRLHNNELGNLGNIDADEAIN